RVLLELGLLATSERAEEPYDLFRGRLVFTIRDLRDRPIGFGARRLDPKSDAPKYINSPESPVFHKGEELYGLDRARHSIRREERAAVVEGFTDVIALHRAGMPFAVAGLGTAFTREQAQRLARYAKRAYLLYDSDGPGLRATFRTGDVLLSAGIHPMVVTLPSGEDPDSLIRREGPEAMGRFFEDAIDLLERKLQILRREGYLDRIEGRRRAVDGLLGTLRAVTDPALRDIYLDRASEGVGVRRETLVHEIAKAPRPGSAELRRSSAHKPQPLERPASSATTRAERELALLLVRDPSLIGRAVRLGLTASDFQDRGPRETFEALANAFDEGLELDDWSSLTPSAQSFVARLLEDAEELSDPITVFEAATSRLRNRALHERRAIIDREMADADEEHQLRLLEEKQRIVERLRESGDTMTFMPSGGGARPVADRRRVAGGSAGRTSSGSENGSE
ncbi:MAG: toprim domain-containing protein, partial [Gemmatimonadetes bacterium]|nr:toprim domain-containing protein [Gemmatimonadota bacterium]